jgi:subtilisin family serine protease
MTNAAVRYRAYLILRVTPDFSPVAPLHPGQLRAFVEDHLFPALDIPEDVAAELRPVSPSFDWALEIEGLPEDPPPPDRIVISFETDNPEALGRFEEQVRLSQEKLLPPGIIVLGVGDDPGGGNADHWCPGSAGLALFGDRDAARDVLRLDRLAGEGLTGSRVNVVIIDDGLNKQYIPNWGGGLRHGSIKPGSAPRDSHGMMIARNVLGAAPDAVLYDVPLIPSRITNIPVFVSGAEAVFGLLRQWIDFLRQWEQWSGPWILVNAWAIFDRASELSLGNYTQNKNPGGHPFNNLIGEIVGGSLIDIVFAAGNCGQFCPSRRCGRIDRGPRHSIWGANSHPAVITAGAVRTDDLWLGYSSQGPGQPLLATEKPDFCAPSDFAETTDAAVGNTGTSAATGLTAGVVAALRSNPKWDAGSVPPHTLKQELIDTARQTVGPGWNGRLGHGILDAGAAFDALSLDFP